MFERSLAISEQCGTQRKLAPILDHLALVYEYIYMYMHMYVRTCIMCIPDATQMRNIYLYNVLCGSVTIALKISVKQKRCFAGHLPSGQRRWVTSFSEGGRYSEDICILVEGC